MHRALIPLAVVIAAFAAGCGSSKSLSASDLRTKADAICAQVNKQTAAASNNFDQDLKLSEAGVKKLEALKPPDSLKSGYATFTGDLDATLPKLKQLVKDADAKDNAAAQALEPTVNALDKKVDSAASALGLTECAKD